jgi:hypothetical protein
MLRLRESSQKSLRIKKKRGYESIYALNLLNRKHYVKINFQYSNRTEFKQNNHFFGMVEKTF